MVIRLDFMGSGATSRRYVPLWVSRVASAIFGVTLEVYALLTWFLHFLGGLSVITQISYRSRVTSKWLSYFKPCPSKSNPHTFTLSEIEIPSIEVGLHPRIYSLNNFLLSIIVNIDSLSPRRDSIRGEKRK